MRFILLFLTLSPLFAAPGAPPNLLLILADDQGWPTLLAAANVTPPSNHTFDGVSLLPLLHGESLPDRPLYFQMPLHDLRWAATHSAVIREGDWKLIEPFGDSFDADLR